MQFSADREQALVWLLQARPDEHVVFPGTSYRPDGDVLITRQGRRVRLHRYLWVLLIGPLSRNEFLLRRCTVPRCQNPHHFDKSNSPLGVEAPPKLDPAPHPKLEVFACGHPATEENTFSHTEPNGREHKRCRKCKVEASRRNRARARQRRNEQAILGDQS
jgi:hypothetical protein